MGASGASGGKSGGENQGAKLNDKGLKSKAGHKTFPLLFPLRGAGSPPGSHPFSPPFSPRTQQSLRLGDANYASIALQSLPRAASKTGERLSPASTSPNIHPESPASGRGPGFVRVDTAQSYERCSDASSPACTASDCKGCVSHSLQSDPKSSRSLQAKKGTAGWERRLGASRDGSLQGSS